MNAKRRVFVEEYLECWNATKAAEKAGYAHPGSQGSRLLQNVEIQDAIKSRIDELAMTADEVLLRLGEQARGDISEFVGETGNINWVAVKAKGQLIKRISHTVGKHSSVELHDAQSALALIGKHHKLFTERIEHSGEVDLGLDDAADKFDEHISRLIAARSADADQGG